MEKNGDWRNGNDKDKGLTAWAVSYTHLGESRKKSLDGIRLKPKY